MCTPHLPKVLMFERKTQAFAPIDTKLLLKVASKKKQNMFVSVEACVSSANYCDEKTLLLHQGSDSVRSQIVDVPPPRFSGGEEK